MNKILRTSLAMVSMAFPLVMLSACQDFSSPKGVAGTIGQALQKNDYKTFYAALTDQALDQYGSETGFALLKSQLSHYSKFALSEPTLTSTSQDGSLNLYRLDVYGHNQRTTPDLLWRLEISCLTTHTLQNTAPNNCYGPNGTPIPGCQQGPTLETSTNCRIWKLTSEL